MPAKKKTFFHTETQKKIFPNKIVILLNKNQGISLINFDIS